MAIKNIIIYIVDCLRPDFLGCYGFDKPTSPHIDQLAKEGAVFRKAYTTGTWTKPVAIPLVTGIHPSCFELAGQSLAFGGYQHFIQKLAKEKGFKTRVFSNNLYFSRAFGFTEGFDEEAELDLLEKNYRAKPSNKAIVNKINWQLTATIPSQYLHELFYKSFKPADKNFVVFWSMDPHSPYCLKGDRSYFNNSPADYLEGETYFWRRNRLATRLQKFFKLLLFNLFGFYDKKRIAKIKSLYSDAIRHNDERIGEMIDYLKQKGEYEDTLFILFGDHGESFYEHGEYGHCSSPYDEVINIPLLIKFPGKMYAGKEVKEPVSLLDIYPTILELLGAKGSPQDIDGRSLINCLEGINKENERGFFIESLYKTDLYSAVLLKGDKKYFRLEPRGNWLRKLARRLALPADRSKENSLQLKGEFEEMRSNYRSRIEKYQPHKREMVNSAKVIERLKNLGYF